ncbi:aldo/keto reductase [Streptomyces sp. NPDC101455]|uniref:aldo/keto reductase n=1 Tax=Streptomyces sp. NPDC101455 TaxID=3366142 RepID=UPI003809C992
MQYRRESLGSAARGPHGGANSRRYVRAACEATLRRLGTDYIDLYQLHFDDPATPLEETIGALDDLVRMGKVLYTGASNLPAYRLMKALTVGDRLGGTRFIAFQGRYDPTPRTLEREHLPLLGEEGLGLIAESPLTSDPPDLRGVRHTRTRRIARAWRGRQCNSAVRPRSWCWPGSWRGPWPRWSSMPVPSLNWWTD